jgi:hypothetical protein
VAGDINFQALIDAVDDATRFRAALDAIARAYDPEGACLETCASWRDDDCNCGYMDAATDVVDYAVYCVAGSAKHRRCPGDQNARLFISEPAF